MAEAIYRKYRPMTFADVTDQNHVKITVQNQIASGNMAHAYLFAGPRGVGKTTIARLLAKTLNCENRKEGDKEPCNKCSNCEEMNIGKALDIVEIDAASHTGVDNVRENIIESVRFAPNKGKFKVFIIDEVHMLSTSAFNALLKTLEEPPAHALFVLATTEIHKIPQTILSRCQRFDFHRIASVDMVKRLQEIAKSEGVKVDDDVLQQISRLSEGCLRDGESLLGQILALGEKEITKEQASIILPVTNTTLVVDVTDAIVRKDVTDALNKLNGFVDQGGSVKNLVDEMIEFVRTMLMLKLGAPYHDHYDADAMSAMKKMMENFSPVKCSTLLDKLLSVKSRPTYEALPHLPLEIAIVLFCGENQPASAPMGKVPAEEPSLVVEKKPEPVVAAAAPQPAEPEREEDEPAPIPGSPVIENPKSFTMEEITSKWGRCCDAVRKRSVALPLALVGAKPIKCDGKVLELGFDVKFHFENMDQPKHVKIISDSVNEVMQSDVVVKPIYLKAEEEQALGELASAFGGEIVD
jgi:DNA polymerase-3 subunit gamma/tau